MKYVRIGIIVMFLAAAVVFTYNWYQDKQAIDKTYPVIQVGSEQIDVSVKSAQEELLKDVIAKDEKDGDLTKSIIIESVSKFTDKKNHICNVTYAVADSDNNVTKKTRRIRFTDYESPKFTLSQQLCFEVGSEMSVADVIGATDDYDGDISRNVKILSSTVSNRTAGEYTITAQVTNSLGDTAKIKAAVVIRQENNLNPVITLKENIVYLKVGDKFDEKSYIKSVKDYKGNSISNDKVTVISSSVDTKKAGCYTVQYAVGSEQDNAGSTYLAVVVED
ncbi:MAG: immunoglobulin-like domain-containing protein [Eubacterium sp.]